MSDEPEVWTGTGRPDWIGKDEFRKLMAGYSIGKLFTIGGVPPTSYLAQREKAGRPISFVSGPKNESGYRGIAKRLYRPVDVFIAAKADGLEIWKAPAKLSTEETVSRTAAARRELETLEAKIARRRSTLSRTDRQIKERSTALEELPTPLPPQADLQLARLDEHEIIVRSIPMSDTGIYFLVSENSIVYVGRSVSFITRLQDHLRDEGKTFDRVYFLPCSSEEIDHLERAYIQKFRPPLNTVHIR